MFQTLTQDLHFAVRGYLRKPAAFAIPVLTLALGIGANTAVFSLIDAVLLRPLAYKDPDRLVAIWGKHSKDPKVPKVFNLLGETEDWARHATVFEESAATAWISQGQTLTGRGPARRVKATFVMLPLFKLLGVPAARGRTFNDADLGGACSVVLSNGFWQSEFGAADGAIGETLRLDNQLCPIVGVMPPGFVFYPEDAQIWTLITPSSQIARDRDVYPAAFYARLKPGVTIAAAEAEVSAIDARFRDTYAREHRQIIPAVIPLREDLMWFAGRKLRESLWIAFGAVVVILLIACVNVANLLLGRSIERQRELAVRVAVGCGQGRLVRQLLTESLLLAASGAFLGTWLAWAVAKWVKQTRPLDLPSGTDVTISWSVLGFTLGLTLVTSLIFGLAPAVTAWRASVAGALRAGNSGAYGPSSQRLGKLLVAGEVALSFALLVAAGLFIQSLYRVNSLPLGFSEERLLYCEIAISPDRKKAPEQLSGFYDRLAADVSRTAGVTGVAVTSILPLRDLNHRQVSVDGRPGGHAQDSGEQSIGAGYFGVMGVPLVKGRVFDSRDSKDAAMTAVINTALARRYFPEGDEIGKRIKLGRPEDSAPWLTVVGVTGDELRMSNNDDARWSAMPTVYRPVAQSMPPRFTLLVRAAGDAGALKAVVPRLVAGFDADTPTGEVKTFEERKASMLNGSRFRTVLLSGFGVLGLALALIGLYGILSQMTQRRMREMGIRAALGATHGDILRLVLGQGIGLALSGLAVGAAAAWAGARVIASMLDSPPGDPMVGVAVAALLLVAATGAVYVPARRAAKADPLTVLRSD